MSEPGSDPAIGDLQGLLGAGSTCITCGFRYMEHKGHIIACPVCALAAALQRLAVAELALGFPIVADHVKRYEDLVGELRAALVRAVEALQRVEWVKAVKGSGTYCLGCGGWKDEGHRPDCYINAALDAQERE